MKIVLLSGALPIELKELSSYGFIKFINIKSFFKSARRPLIHVLAIFLGFKIVYELVLHRICQVESRQGPLQGVPRGCLISDWASPELASSPVVDSSPAKLPDK